MAGVRRGDDRSAAGAIFAFPLQAGAITVGTIDLYRRRPGWLTPEELAIVLDVVDVATVAPLGMRLDDGDGAADRCRSPHPTQRRRPVTTASTPLSRPPAIDCVRTGEPVVAADLARGVPRWPGFAPEALREGFASVHALRLRRETIGALNLFGHEPGAMIEQDPRVAQALADTATIGILPRHSAVRCRPPTGDRCPAARGRPQHDDATSCRVTGTGQTIKN